MILLASSFSCAFGACTSENEVVPIDINATILDASHMPFHTHAGVGFENALALNVEYSQIPAVREKIEKRIGKELKFFADWNAGGEAHITTVTPPEFWDVLREFIHIDEINQIARQQNIQQADLKILGIGSAKLEVEGAVKETYFFIADSFKLREIRHAVFELFVQRGGNPSDFDPAWFFPHITIGFTHNDLSIGDGVLKDVKHSYDHRFKVNVKQS